MYKPNLINYQLYFIYLFHIFILAKVLQLREIDVPNFGHLYFFLLNDLTDCCYIIAFFQSRKNRRRNFIFANTWPHVARNWPTLRARVHAGASTSILPAYVGSATVISGPSCAATHTHSPRYAYVRETDYATAVQLRASRVDCDATATGEFQ